MNQRQKDWEKIRSFPCRSTKVHPSNFRISFCRIRPYGETQALNFKPKLLPPHAKTLLSLWSLSSHLLDQSMLGQKVGVVIAKQRKIVAVSLIQSWCCSYGCSHSRCCLCLQSQYLTPLFIRAPDNLLCRRCYRGAGVSPTLFQRSLRVSEECAGNAVQELISPLSLPICQNLILLNVLFFI